MQCLKWVVIGVVALSLTGVVLRAADEQKPADSTSKTETKDEKKAMGSGRLFAPYSKMTSLTDDQKEKIGAIRKDFNAQRKELEKKEREQIFALLSDDQKKEVEKLEGDKKSGGAKKADAKAPEKAPDSSSTEKKE